MRVKCDFVLFCFCLVKRLLIIVYNIFVYYELNMQEWVSIYETYECDIGAPDIHRFPRVDGL